MELGESEFVRQGKHDLTPTSKMAAMPQAKRFEVGKNKFRVNHATEEIVIYILDAYKKKSVVMKFIYRCILRGSGC